MSMIFRSSFARAVGSAMLAASLFHSGPAIAGVIKTQVSSTSLQAYASDVSTTDLLNGLIPVITGWNFGENAHPNELTDGVHGGLHASVPGDNVKGAWTTVGATAQYNLGAGQYGKGYSISSIQSIADWQNVGFGNQAWTIEVKPVGGVFATLAEVNYQPLADGGTTKVTLTDDAGMLAVGVESIKVTVGSQGAHSSGAFVWRELDVFGAATVPEPSTALLFAAGSLVAAYRARKRQ